MAKAWCITKPNGTLFGSVPVANSDAVYYSSHRVYGPRRLSHLMVNWDLVEVSIGDPQFYKAFNHEAMAADASRNKPLMLFEKRDASTAAESPRMESNLHDEV